MANTIVGKILSIGQTVNIPTKSGKEFTKRELVLDASRYDEFTGQKRENYPTFQFTQKRCEELDGYQVGELVEVSFVLSGRSYVKDNQTRYITDIVGYKVERKNSTQPVIQETPAPTPVQQQQPKETGELPF